MTREQMLRRAIDSVNNAWTRSEIEEAERLARAYRSAYPEDTGDYFHGFSHDIAYMKEREAEACRMNLSPEETAEREALLKRTRFGGNPLDDAEDYRLLLDDMAQVRAWLARYPEDPSAAARLYSLEDAKLSVDLTLALRAGDEAEVNRLLKIQENLLFAASPAAPPTQTNR